MTTCADRRVELRPAVTRCRMSSSARAESASDDRTCRRPGPRSLALRMSAATARSALGSSRSSARPLERGRAAARARAAGRPAAASCGWIAGAAALTVAGIACSRPTAPAMVSRSDSVHEASASIRATAARSARHTTEQGGPREDEQRRWRPQPRATWSARARGGPRRARSAVLVPRRSRRDGPPRRTSVRRGRGRSESMSSTTPPPTMAPRQMARTTVCAITPPARRRSRVGTRRR